MREIDPNCHRTLPPHKPGKTARFDAPSYDANPAASENRLPAPHPFGSHRLAAPAERPPANPMTARTTNYDGSATMSPKSSDYNPAKCMISVRPVTAWGLINAAALFRPVVAGITHHAAAAGQRQGNRTLSVPARRCARKPQRVNPQTRTASARAGAGGERTHNVRHYATLGRCRRGVAAAADGRAAARLGAAWPRRSGGAEPPQP